jgi:hypothetical protein
VDTHDAALAKLVRMVRPERLEVVLDRPVAKWSGASLRQMLETDPDAVLEELERITNPDSVM